MKNTASSLFDNSSLICGMAIPIAYFGIQFVAAPFCNDYSFLSDDASTLGSPRSTLPAIFNIGSFVVGMLFLFASVGITRSLVRVGNKRWIVLAILAALISGAIACFNAGFFPLPDERHSTGVFAIFGMAIFLLPFLLPFVSFRSVDYSRLRIYFWLNLLVLICLIPIISGLFQRLLGAFGMELPWYQDFLNNGSGVLQRIVAAVVFIPCGVLSWYLHQCCKTADKLRQS